MNDENEWSVASAGSAAASVEIYIDKSACGLPESRPLRRPVPTLTDAEREAITELRNDVKRLEDKVQFLSRSLDRHTGRVE